MSNPVRNLFLKPAQAAALLVFSAAGHVAAQAFTHADSGWVRLWNGKDWSDKDIYSRVYGATAAPVYPPDSTGWKILYPGTDTAAIYVASVANNKQGNIGTKKADYSHYRMRVEAKFDVLGANATGGDNAGITYHTDETAIRMSNNWPRSIEFQLRQIETGSAFSIQQVTFDIKANGNNYNPNGTLTTGCEAGCPNRNYNAVPRISNGSNGKTRWLRYDLTARGSDSAIHMVNDTIVLKLSNIRIFNDANRANKTPNGPWDHGGIGLQSEGALVKYRHWEIMEFHKDTPKGENYLHRFFLDAPAKSEAVPGGAAYAIKWRTLGTIPTVNIEYGTGATGAWTSVASNIANTGTYDWAVPASVTGQVRVRISGPAWAGADSSNGTGTSGIGAGHPSRRAVQNPISFSIEGKGEVLSDIGMYSRVEVLDVFGRSVRAMPVQGGNLIWNRRDAGGTKVQPGIYFIRLLGPGMEKTERSLIF
jgi:hypothetical protein